MNRSRLAGALTLAVLLACGATAAAQDVGLAGTITDTTDAVLPGATVTATHVDTGNAFTGVSDTAGQYRIVGMRPGVYRITAELSGFNQTTQENVELLLGQRAIANFKLVLSSLQETVTVTGDAPLVDMSQSTARRQHRSAAGAGIAGQRPQLDGADDADAGQPHQQRRANRRRWPPPHGSFQLNMDGQQVTQLIAQTGYGQPRFSREAMAEFEFITSRFDATQGRSSGAQVNAVTKSGTNAYSGSLAATSVTTTSMRRTSSSAKYCRTRTSRSPARSAGRSSATGRTSSATTRGSATRSRSRSPAPTRRSISRCSSARTSSAWPGPASTSNWAAARA